MGKRDKRKKDPEKKAKARAAKEAKADKKAAKRLAKENSSPREGGEGGVEGDDIDAVLASYAQRSLELSTPVVTVLGENNGESPFPAPPRGNFTLTNVPGGDLVMFGGEYYDGSENVVFDELLRWNPDGRREEEDTDDDDSVCKGGEAADEIPVAGVPGEEDEFFSAAKPLEEDKADEARAGVWKRIQSPPPNPPARCSHTTVYHNNALYVFGGELATAEKYHHYKDMWKFDLKTNLWMEIKPRGGLAPPSRSGHRCIVWRHYMVMFGGFFEALRETRWYNDLWIYDFPANAWQEMSYSKLATIPAPRSAFDFCLSPTGDTAYIYGGYSKLTNPAPGTRAEAKVHNDCWALHLKGITSGRLPTWDRVSRRGEYPSIRSGTSCIGHKSRMLAFGGVLDDEREHHAMHSVFYDDLFAFDMERRRWFKLGLKAAAKGGKRRRRKANDDVGERDENPEEAIGENPDESGDDEDIEMGMEGEAKSSGWDLDRLRANMFAFIDGDGNVVYEKIQESDHEKDASGDEDGEVTALDDSSKVDEERGGQGSVDAEASVAEAIEKKKLDSSEGLKQVEFKTAVLPEPLSGLIPSGAIGASEVMAINNDSGVPEAVAREMPLPRIHAAVAVRGSTLYVYGGVLEVGAREVTLDDCWSLDLNRRENWVCIWKGTMHKQVWRGINEDEESSYISTGMEDSGDYKEDDYENDWVLNDTIGEGEVNEEDTEAREKAHKEARKAAKAAKKEKMKEKMARLKEQYNLDNVQETPEIDEAMSSFYSRTAQYWEGKAAERIKATEALGGESISAISTKELKREGFNMAKERYDHLKPVMDELKDLEVQSTFEKKKKEGRSRDKDKKKKGKKEKKRNRVCQQKGEIHS